MCRVPASARSLWRLFDEQRYASRSGREFCRFLAELVPRFRMEHLLTSQCQYEIRRVICPRLARSSDLFTTMTHSRRIFVLALR